MSDELMAVDGTVIGIPTPEQKRDERRDKWVQGLRDLADWVESHPLLGKPPSDVNVFYFPEIKDMRGFAHAFGRADKSALGDSYFTLNKTFGPHTIQATWNREKVCERVVVGEEEIEEDVVVSQTTEKRKVKREKIEWRCPKILAPKEPGDGA